jgi:hypothetical protein
MDPKPYKRSLTPTELRTMREEVAQLPTGDFKVLSDDDAGRLLASLPTPPPPRAPSVRAPALEAPSLQQR